MPDLYKSLCYCTNLRRSANFISDFYDSAFKKIGITVSQYYLLTNLAVLKSTNITNWAKRVGLERSTMVRNINLLISKNLVESTEGHGKVFKLSSKGKEILIIANLFGKKFKIK